MTQISSGLSRSFLLHAGWLIDGTGGAIQENVLVEVEDGLLSSIKEMDAADLNQKNIQNFSHCTLLPGLIDSHVHLFMSGTNNPDIRSQQLDAKFKTIRPVISRHIRQHLAHGVVAVRDGGDYAGHTSRYKKECLHSESDPICLRAAGKAWRAPDRYGKLIGRPPSSLDNLAQAIARQEEPVDHVKIVNSGLNSLEVYGKETLPQFSADQLRAAVLAAGERGRRTMVHANGKLPVALAIEAGCHSIEHGFFMGRENLKKMAERQILWIPTAVTMKAYSESLAPGTTEERIAKKNLDHQMEQILCAMQIGVPIAVGTDSGSLGVHHGSAVMEEFRLLLQAGFPLSQAVQCATSNGARTLGLESQFGKLTPGMPAHFLAVRGNPGELPDALDTPETILIWGEEYKV